MFSIRFITFAIMDTSKLISQAQFARDHQVSPQWIAQLIADHRLDIVRIGKIDYIFSNAKIKPKRKKKSTEEIILQKQRN